MTRLVYEEDCTAGQSVTLSETNTTPKVPGLQQELYLVYLKGTRQTLSPVPRILCRLRPSNTETVADFAAGSSSASPDRSSPLPCLLGLSARPHPPSCQLCLVPSPSTSLVAIYCWTRHRATNSVTGTLPPYCWQELSPCSKSRLLSVYALSHATSNTMLFVGVEACPHARGGVAGRGPEPRGRCARGRWGSLPRATATAVLPSAAVLSC